MACSNTLSRASSNSTLLLSGERKKARRSTSRRGRHVRLFPELISSMRTTGRVVRFGRLRTWNGHVGRAGYGMAMAGTDDHGPGPGRHDGAGDGNRTRTIERLHPVWALTCRFRPRPVPVADPSSPWRM